MKAILAWFPEAELAKKCFCYMDDVSLEVIEEPPLSLSTPLDEYYGGQVPTWHLPAASDAHRAAASSANRPTATRCRARSLGLALNREGESPCYAMP